MRPTPFHVQADEAASDHEVDHFMDHIKKDGEKKTRAGIFYVDLDAERGSGEADDGLGDSVEPDGLMSKPWRNRS